jgi:RNA polymerase-binding transcription factor DksA
MMTAKQLEKYRARLRDLSARLNGTARALEDQTRVPVGGQSAGNLSNAPLHLGDLGTEVYLQELNSTLYENEQYLREEVEAALDRIDRGTYGRCERCGKAIAARRLDSLPYARHCTRCAGVVQSGRPVNLNDGRGQSRSEADAPRVEGARPGGSGRGSGEAVASIDLESGVVPDDVEPDDDVHAAGTAGGGTAVGGLAGTNLGDGAPDNADLEDATGSGDFDVGIDADEGDEVTQAYAGPSGGAVGGTPANKRAVGGKTRRSLAPRSDTEGPARQ